MKKTVTLLMLLLASGNLFAQNLVPNNGFDIYSACPSGSSQSTLTPPWTNVANATGSPDYMNACFAGGQQGVPTNFYGFQQPVSPGGYYGLITHYSGGQEVREYMTVPLTSPLIANKSYSVGFYASLSDNFAWATDHLGAHISVGPVTGSGGFAALPFVPQIDHPAGTLLSDMINWTLISGTYTAAGGETHITIGNFYSDPNTLISNVNPSGLGWAYYYIDEVFVIPIDNITITGDSVICLGDTVTLTASNDSVFAWANSLNPGVILDTDSILQDMPTVTTTYLVYGSNDTASFTVQVNIPPTVNLGMDTTLCQGEQLVLSAATPGATYLWQDNSTLSNYTLTQSGTYWVEVTLDGCSASDSITVTYTPLPVVDIGNDSTLCAGEILQLDATTSGGSYLWNDNSTGSTLAVSQSGVYWVEVTVNGCSSADTVSVSFTPLPVVGLGNDITLCEGTSATLDATQANATYLWQDNSTGSTLTVNQTGTYWVFVTVNNCSSSDTINVTFNPLPVFSLGSDVILCQGASAVLDATTAGATYTWNDNSTSPTYTVSQTGTYWVTVTVNNCSATDSVNVTVNPLPVVNLGVDQSICDGETAILNAAVTNATYLWQDNSTAPSFNVSQTGTYWVVVTLNNCSDSDTVSVTVNPLPSVNLGSDITFCEDESVTLDATVPGGLYNWQDNSTSPTFLVTQPGTYWVEVMVNNCSAADTLVAEVIECLAILELPNIFTPNGDGLNDSFLPIVMKGITSAHLMVFSRWGQIVHESSDLSKGWSGSDLPDATYFWTVTYRTVRNESKSQSGTVKLVR